MAGLGDFSDIIGLTALALLCLKLPAVNIFNFACSAHFSYWLAEYEVFLESGQRGTSCDCSFETDFASVLLTCITGSNLCLSRVIGALVLGGPCVSVSVCKAFHSFNQCKGDLVLVIRGTYITVIWYFLIHFPIFLCGC